MTPAGRRSWGLFAAAVVAVGALDLAVLANVKAFLGSGYNTHSLEGALDIGGFILLGAACDAALLAALWAVFRWPLGILRNGIRRDAVALGFAAAVPAIVDAALHRLHQTLGDVLYLDLLLELTGGDTVGATSEVLSTLPSLGVIAMAVFLGAFALVWGSRWVSAGTPAESSGVGTRSLAATAGVTLVAGLIALQGAQAHAAWSFGLGWKPSGLALSALAKHLSDFDLDGSGAWGIPPDTAPFDGARHPYAVEIAGNGIDENGFAGDLPADFAVQQPVRAVTPQPSNALVLIFLEGFRADLIGVEFEGLEITPHLNRLARDGATSDEAFTNSPMTWSARAQLFQGRVVATPTDATLVDDFRNTGFEVAWFSGQHDGLRQGPAHLGFERADVFRDARSHLSTRTSRSARPISLQIPWKTVVGDAEDFLDRRTPDRPLFLYVNLVDTHFPYHHDEMDAIVGGDRLERQAIVRDNRDAVWRAYLNAAANVDRGIGRLLAALDSTLGEDRYGVVVTADHGEAFYEPYLGHGQALDRLQTQVPLVVWHIGGVLPEPLALSDLRGLLTTHAHKIGPEQRAQFVADPGREIFQYAGNLERPQLLALRGGRAPASWSPPSGKPVAPDGSADRLVHTWEAHRAAQDARRGEE